MANRSCLYSSNTDPDQGPPPEGRTIKGISEFNYDIPLAFKILLSGNPRKCQSSIWTVSEKIALIGDYDSGVDKLMKFMEGISAPEAVPLREEAFQFLNDAKNRNKYFILECGEIFEMCDGELEEQNDNLLKEILDIDSQIQKVLKELNNPISSAPESQKNQAIAGDLAAGLKNEIKDLFSLFGSKDAKSEEQSQWVMDQLVPIVERKMKKPKGMREKLESLGLGYWSNILYFHLE